MKAISLASGPMHSHPLLTDVGLLLLRLWAGGVMAIAHGIPKIGKLSDDPIQFADPLGIGVTLSLICTVLTEFVGGILIALGLFTRAALASLVFTFIIVVFIIKWSKGFGAMELGASFLLMYVALILTGPGRFSLDSLINKKFKELPAE